MFFISAVYLFLHHCRLHVGNLADGELGRDFSGDDGFGSGAGECALDAVDGHGGETPQMSQKVDLHDDEITHCDFTTSHQQQINVTSSLIYTITS